MSLAAPSFQIFRSCRASFSSRALTRPSLGRCPTRLSRVGTRCYSEEKTSEGRPSSAQDEAAKESSKDDAPAQGDPCAEVRSSLKAKEAEVSDLTSRLRYLQADFLNLQRNAAREKEQTKDYAISRFASDLLETVDVLSIALKSVHQDSLKMTPNDATPTSESSQPEPSSPKNHATYLQELYTGVEMTHRLLLQTLFKYQIKPFDPTGDKFDPNLHEALYQAPIPGKEPGTVIDCQKVGYRIKDRVLRAAQVGVAQEMS